MSLQLNQPESTVTGHSSVVTMTLYIGSAEFAVLQSSKTAIKVAGSENLPLGDAILETTVDGRVHRRSIRVLSPQARSNWINILDR